MIPLSLTYLSICGSWFLLNRKGKLWELEPTSVSETPLVFLTDEIGRWAFVLGKYVYTGK